MITNDDIARWRNRVMYQEGDLSVADQNFVRDCQIALAAGDCAEALPETRDQARIRVEVSIERRQSEVTDEEIEDLRDIAWLSNTIFQMCQNALGAYSFTTLESRARDRLLCANIIRMHPRVTP